MQTSNGEKFINEDVLPQAGDVILDLGCGTGELSALLAKLVGLKGKVFGVDPDRERILLAQKSHFEIPNLSFLEGSDSNFPGMGFPVYDIIFSHLVLQWIPDKERVFSNLYNALKKGGKLTLQYGQNLSQIVSNSFKILNPENEERLSQMILFEPRSVIEKYCESAGFVILKSYECKLQYDIENMEVLLKWLWSTTHGAFDPSLVTEERSQKFQALYSSKNGRPCLDLQREDLFVNRLIAVKQATGPS